MTALNTYQLLHIKDIEDPRIEEAVKLLVIVFKDDPISMAFNGGCPSKYADIIYRAILRATVISGQLHIAVNDDGLLVGTACWFPPGVDCFSDDVQQEQGAKQFFELLAEDNPPLLDWWLTKCLPANSDFANSILAKSADENVKLDNWTLYSFAVHPEYRRRGIGRQLITVGEVQAKNKGVKVIFEADNPKNVGIYKRLGYENAGASKYIEGPPGCAGYNLYLMVKDPASAQ
ncbi:acyl-CoA N-acyltransferase [Agrocybe pediades]|nr:acyl-CoA N-acyltransferase [Agrocybe pediades]